MSSFARLGALSFTPISVLKAACHKVSVPLKSKRAARPDSLSRSLSVPLSLSLSLFHGSITSPPYSQKIKNKNVKAQMLRFDFKAVSFLPPSSGTLGRAV